MRGIPVHILVVDDEPKDLELASYLLEHDGNTVEQASSGSQAIQSIRTRRPDIVVSDLMMPGVIDGHTLAALVRSDPDLSDLPMLAITCDGTTLTTEAVALDAGYDGYIIKPIHAREFIDLVHEMVTSN